MGYAWVMVPLKGIVRDGQLTVRVPVDLPEDTEVELDFVRVLDPGDLSADDRARLDASLELSEAQAESGQAIAAEEFFRKLRARR